MTNLTDTILNWLQLGGGSFSAFRYAPLHALSLIKNLLTAGS